MAVPAAPTVGPLHCPFHLPSAGARALGTRAFGIRVLGLAGLLLAGLLALPGAARAQAQPAPTPAVVPLVSALPLPSPAPGPEETATPGPLPMPVANARLTGVVLLSRHGMRGPTKAIPCGPGDTRCLAGSTQQAWPTLDVAAGHLTRQGFARVYRMGEFYRDHYAALGIVQPGTCPGPAQVSFISDDTERTVMTAGAVMDGMFAGCLLPPLAIHARLYEGPSCGYENKAARAAATALVGSWKQLADGPLKAPLAAMSTVLGPLPEATCLRYSLPLGCTLADVPATASDPGPIELASQPAEQFLMQYGGGRSGDELAWGRLPQATGKGEAAAVSFVNAVHAASDRYEHMPRYQAVKEGSPVLYPVMMQLDALAAGAAAPFIFFASHDNFLLNVGGMLQLDWTMPGYNPFQVPPGGAIAFERWQPEANGQPDGKALIRVVYFAQTPQQLHDDTPLDAAHPPGSQVLKVPGCPDRPDGACPWMSFREIAYGAIDMACVDTTR